MKNNSREILLTIKTVDRISSISNTEKNHFGHPSVKNV